MKFDTMLQPTLAEAGPAARQLEAVGFDGVWIPETGHNPFFPLLLAAGQTEKLELATGIAVAFARSPMTMAQEAWDLAAHSKGRFRLGLGSQVQAHVTKRFSMPWDQPVERMRDFIRALRAIWKSFQDGTPMRYEGTHYRHTLLTPFFNPGPIEHPDIPIYLAAVGPRMTELAGEMADGILLHAFTNQAFFEQVTLPALERGLQRAGRRRDGFTIAGPVFVITGPDVVAAPMEKAVRQNIAFYGSTPAYGGVLEIIGAGDLHKELHRLSRLGQWKEMAQIIPDAVVDAFAVRAPLEDLAGQLKRRFAAYDRLVSYLPLPPSALDAVGAVVRAVQSEEVPQ